MPLSNPISLNVHLSGAGFPVLCLHGHPGSGASLSVFTQHLSQRFFTLAPDLRGYGQSQVQEAFQMEDHLADLEALLERHQIQGCIVLGWSLGGILALELALRRPQWVRGLILIATAARPRGDHPPITWQDYLYTGLASLVNWLQPGCHWNIETWGQRSLYRYLIAQHTPAAYQYLASAGLPAYLQTSRGAQRALELALRTGYNRLEALPQIACPSLVMAGERDRHITPAASFETAAALPQSDWICYPNTAHLLPWEIPEQILGDLDRWLLRHQLQIGWNPTLKADH